MKAFFQDIAHVVRVAINAWVYRRHLRNGGNPDATF